MTRCFLAARGQKGPGIDIGAVRALAQFGPDGAKNMCPSAFARIPPWRISSKSCWAFSFFDECARSTPACAVCDKYEYEFASPLLRDPAHNASACARPRRPPESAARLAASVRAGVRLARDVELALLELCHRHHRYRASDRMPMMPTATGLSGLFSVRRSHSCTHLGSRQRS